MDKKELIDRMIDKATSVYDTYDKGYNECLNDCIDLVKESLEGYTLVPDEPTDKMLDVISDSCRCSEGYTSRGLIAPDCDWHERGDIYKAMIEASRGGK